MSFEEVYRKYEEQCEEACLDKFIYDFQQERIDELEKRIIKYENAGALKVFTELENLKQKNDQQEKIIEALKDESYEKTITYLELVEILQLYYPNVYESIFSRSRGVTG